MRFEHCALNVADPLAVAAWYCEHFGLKAVIAGQQPPYAHFLRDSGGYMMLELYHNPEVPCPDYALRHHLEFHLAFTSVDAEGDCQRLCTVGAQLVEWVRPPDGSRIAMLRDPWGLAIQLCQRSKPMHQDH